MVLLKYFFIQIYLMEIAFVLISCDLGYEEPLIKDLKHFDSVKDVLETFGAYDIIAKVESPDKDKLRKTITQKIRRLEHVLSTQTLIEIQGQD